MTQIFNIKRGDTSPAIKFALEPSDITLNGAAVQFQMRVRVGATVIDAPATIDSSSPPIVSYAWAAQDTATPGWYEAEFRVTYFDGSVETFPNRGFINVSINEDVADA